MAPGKPQARWRVFSFAALTSAAIFCLIAYLWSQGQTVVLGGSLRSVQQQLAIAAGDVPSYRFEFLGYEPSVWEQEVLRDIEQYKARPELVCDNSTSTRRRLQTWLNTTRTASDNGGLQLDADVFSKFRYRDARTGQEVVTHIEPMVRHFRHPLAPAPHCMVQDFKVDPSSEAPEPVPAIEDRSYLLLLDLRQGGLPLPRSYPGRKYLFDLGTGLYPTGLTWFVEKYGSRGVVFDEIWGWEVTERRPKHYWADVPPAVRSVLHYYNIPAAADASSPDNPVNILRRVYRPGDFVVFKLDIDTGLLERAIFRQILEDPQVVGSIAEMMYEMHYDHNDMRLYFGNPAAEWHDVQQAFVQARLAGLRLHYWP